MSTLLNDFDLFCSIMWPINTQEYAAMKISPNDIDKKWFRDKYGLEEYLFCLREFLENEQKYGSHISYEFNVYHEALRYLRRCQYVTVVSSGMPDGLPVHGDKIQIKVTPEGIKHLITEVPSDNLN